MEYGVYNRFGYHTFLVLISEIFLAIKNINKPLQHAKFQTNWFETVENRIYSKLISDSAVWCDASKNPWPMFGLNAISFLKFPKFWINRIDFHKSSLSNLDIGQLPDSSVSLLIYGFLVLFSNLCKTRFDSWPERHTNPCCATYYNIGWFKHFNEERCKWYKQELKELYRGLCSAL